MTKPSRTDWKRLSTMDDKDIDTDDMPALGDDFFSQAQLHLPTKKPVTIRLDADVLDWFKHQGKGYQTKINTLLRRYMESHAHRG